MNKVGGAGFDPQPYNVQSLQGFAALQAHRARKRHRPVLIINYQSWPWEKFALFQSRSRAVTGWGILVGRSFSLDSSNTLHELREFYPHPLKPLEISG